MAFDFPASPADGQVYAPGGAISYVWHAPKWSILLNPYGGSAPETLAAPLKTPPDNLDLFGFVDWASGLWRKFTWANLKATFLNLATGGIVAGEIRLKYGVPALVLDSTGGGPMVLQSRKQGMARWNVLMGDGGAEAAGDAGYVGNDFTITPYTDGDAQVGAGPAFKIRRSDRQATFGGEVVAPGINNAGTLTNAGGIELGSQVAAGAAVLDFHTGSPATDYDSRIMGYSGNGAAGGGNLDISAAAVTGTAIATAAQYRANVDAKIVTPRTLFTAAGLVGVAYAAGIQLDLNAGINFQIPVGGPITMYIPLNQKAGMSGVIWFSSTAGQAIAWNGNWFFPQGNKPSVMGGSHDMLWYHCLDGNTLFCTYVKTYTT